MPDDSNALIIDNAGSEITSIDFLIIILRLVYCLLRRALPSLELFVVEQSSSKVAEVNFVSSSYGALMINSLKDFEGGPILLAKFGPVS